MFVGWLLFLSVRLHQIADQRRLAELFRMQKTQVRLKLGPDYCPMNFPFENSISQIESVVDAVIARAKNVITTVFIGRSVSVI
jgi:hypothetical protein